MKKFFFSRFIKRQFFNFLMNKFNGRNNKNFCVFHKFSNHKTFDSKNDLIDKIFFFYIEQLFSVSIRRRFDFIINVETRIELLC